MTVKELAGQIRPLFVVGGPRSDGTKFIKTIPHAPEWVEKMVRDAHADGDLLPDDHRYVFIVEALDSLSEEDDADDVDLEASIYNHELIAWLASHSIRPAYCDEFDEEFGTADQKADIMTRIARGQWYEKNAVLNVVRSALKEQVEQEGEIEEE